MRREDFVSRQQLDLIPERLRKVEETDASQELYRYMWELFEKNKCRQMNIMVVGAGGSYPSAIFAMHKLRLQHEMRRPKVEAVTPQTAVRILTQFGTACYGRLNPKYDLVIGISYSGKTPDIKYVSEICEDYDLPFLLLTGAEKSTLSEIYSESDMMKIVSYFNPEDNTGKERGMISMVSTIAPVIIFNDDDEDYTSENILQNQELLKTMEEKVTKFDICNIARAIKKNPIIHVFYEWDTLPVAADIESKFTEAGIANIVLHEKKNFSHGRYTSLYNQKFALVINLARRGNIYEYKYDINLELFLSKMCKEKSAQYIKIGTKEATPTDWLLESMTMLPYLITAIGEELGIDISKPLKPFPKEAAQLYDYKGDF